MRPYNRLFSDDRAQSSTIGVVLLTAVVIISISAIGVFWVGSLAERADASGPLIETEVSVTDSNITVRHAMGEPVGADSLAVILRNDTASERFTLGAGAVPPDDGDDRFEPAESRSIAHGLGTGSYEVVVIHEPSNTVVHREYVDVRSEEDETDDDGPATNASFTVAPGDPEPGETITFDAGNSSGAGGVQSYEWDWDGMTDATGVTADHTFAATGVYNVSLTVTDGEDGTDTVTRTVDVDHLRAPDDPANPVQGINYQYYEANGEYASMPDFGAETPVRTNVTDQIDLGPDHRDDQFAFRFTGYVQVPEDGQYTLSTRSDDGSMLRIGDQLVVDNGGTHANTTQSGTIGLEAGKHEITVTMFEHGGQSGLEVSWSGPGGTSGVVPATALYRTDDPIAVFAADCSGPECAFDASGSSNPGGSIASYDWTFGVDTTATGTAVNYTFQSGGNYTVSLTVTGDGGGTDTASQTVRSRPYQPALSPGRLTRGVDYRYYEASGDYTALSDVDWSAPTRNGTTDQIDLAFTPSHRESDFAVRYQTYFEVPENDTYTFYTSSDDGSVLYVDGTEVVDNRGLHSPTEASGEVALEAGLHNVTVQYFEHGGEDELAVSYASESVSKRLLPASQLHRSQQVVRWETSGDWDAATTERGVVHEAFGDRSASAVELGYPSDGRWGPIPTAYWPLDEDSGTTVTDVAGDNDGTLEGPEIGAPGTLGTTAYDFDDANQEYVDGATNLAALRGTATLSVWINTTQTGVDTTWQAPGITGVESNGGRDDVFWGWLDGDGQIGIQAGDDGGASSTTAVDDGTWHHVVLTRDQVTGEVEVYVDGTLEDTATSRSGRIGTTFSSIGRIEDTGGSPEYFDGRIEDLAVYDRVLNGSDVSALYSASRNGSLTTATRQFDAPVDPTTLALQNVSASLPAGTSANVTVRSDPDGDGTMEEASGVIELQSGTTEYGVDGLSSESARFAIAIELSSTDVSATPSVDWIELVD